MAKKKRREVQYEDLPISVKNKLRGSRSSRETISSLRATIDVSHFPALLKQLRLFPFRGVVLLPSLGASIRRFRTDVPVFDPIPLHKELAWASAIFKINSVVIGRFCKLKRQIESALILGKIEDCERLIEQLESEFGFSVWLLETKLAVQQMFRGLEAQKAFSAEVRSIRTDGDLISFLAFYMSWRNEDTTNTFQFKKSVSDRAATWQIPVEFRTYILYKLTGDYDLDETTLSAILRYESSGTLIDYYESFVRLSIRTLSSDHPFSTTFKSVILSLVGMIPDPRLNKVAFLIANNGIDYLNHCEHSSIVTDDGLLIADVASVQRNIESELIAFPDDIHLWHNLVLAGLESDYSLSFSSGLGLRFARLLNAVILKGEGYDESVLEGARLTLNFGNFPSASQFESFFGLTYQTHLD